MRRRMRYVEPTAEQRVEELEKELSRLRQKLVQLAPKVEIKCLDKYPWATESRNKLYEWLSTTVQEVVAVAQGYTIARHGVPKEEIEKYTVDRVFCPLCGYGSSSGYGFLFPGGLELHLTGNERVRQCSVMEAAWILAEAYYNKNFREAEERAEKESLEDRKRKELLFQIRPDEAPVLIDEGLWERETRDRKKLGLAEERLQVLGFRKEKNGRVRTYSYEDDRCLVLADPRSPVRITFRVYPKGLMKKQRGGMEFSLQDHHKNNLLEKFRAMLTDVLERHVTR